MEADIRSPVMDVRGLRVLITAGAMGIGRSIAEAFVRAGARVHITDVSEKAVEAAVGELPGLGGTAGDASDGRHADLVTEEIRSHMGGLDVLVNNVGIAGPTGHIDTLSDDDIDRTLGVNLNSHFYFTSRLLPLLRSSHRDPSILAISSVAGRLGYGFRTPYSAAKWGVIGLVKSLAVELGPEGIRANAILPGVVSGPRMDNVISERAKATGVGLEEMRQEYLRKISLRRMVDAQDVANLALFLSSGLARNITGQAISVDGNVEYL